MRQIIESALLLYLAWAAAEDLKKRTVCMRTAVCTMAAGLLLRAVCGAVGDVRQMEWIAGMLPGLLVLAAAWITKEAIGYGDGLVLMVCGVLLGVQGATATLLSALALSCPVSLYYLVVKKSGRKKELPFVPFLFAGYVLWLGMR